MFSRVQAAAVPVAKLAAMEATAKAVEVENKRVVADLEEKTTELAELKTKVLALLALSPSTFCTKSASLQ